MSWEIVRLGDCCTKIGSGATPKGGATVYIEDGVALIRSQNVYNLSFEYDGLTHITDEAAEKLNGVTINPNDVLLNITGDSVARVCMVPMDILPARVNQHVAIIRTGKVLLPQYLLFYLASPYMQAYMLNLAVGKGASRNALTKGMIEDFPIPLPSVEEQQKIVDILSPYNDLVENNQKQIKLLEEAAQRLYKEWFVDLHFPGHETTPITGGIPEGWKRDEVNSIIDLLSGFAFKSADFTDAGTYKIVTIKNVQDGMFDGHNVSRIADVPSKMPAHCYLNNGDILLSLTGNVGRVCVVNGNDYLLNQRVAKLKSDYPAFAYCLFRSNDMFVEMGNLANGAAQQNLSPIKTGQIKILIPPVELLIRFEEVVTVYMKQMLNLNEQIELLQETRDRLLPKLMNGEIEV